MDRSLLFFYCLCGFFLNYFLFKLAKEKYKLQSLTFIFSFIISLVIASSFPTLSTGEWFLVVIASTFTLLFLLAFSTALLKQFLMRRYILRCVENLKYLTPTEMVESLINSHNKTQWYVLYFPLEDAIEIGVNLFAENPIIGKRLYIRTMTNRQMYFIPEKISSTIDLQSNIACTLYEFYTLTPQTKSLIEDYLTRIKNGHLQPWRLNAEPDEK
ncbi:hypothetical protein [Klebsiella aerogenes]|uniref:hypothetical protein n=1 Tax=Klebsiella aerogenes TaxID=548 RepID=UPI0013D58BCD|nr:hypothetical protein [Klebsiella aerogenes]